MDDASYVLDMIVRSVKNPRYRQWELVRSRGGSVASLGERITAACAVLAGMDPKDIDEKIEEVTTNTGGNPLPPTKKPKRKPVASPHASPDKEGGTSSKGDPAEPMTNRELRQEISRLKGRLAQAPLPDLDAPFDMACAYTGYAPIDIKPTMDPSTMLATFTLGPEFGYKTGKVFTIDVLAILQKHDAFPLAERIDRLDPYGVYTQKGFYEGIAVRERFTHPNVWYLVYPSVKKKCFTFREALQELAAHPNAERKWGEPCMIEHWPVPWLDARCAFQGDIPKATIDCPPWLERDTMVLHFYVTAENTFTYWTEDLQEKNLTYLMGIDVRLLCHLCGVIPKEKGKLNPYGLPVERGGASRASRARSGPTASSSTGWTSAPWPTRCATST